MVCVLIDREHYPVSEKNYCIWPVGMDGNEHGPCLLRDMNALFASKWWGKLRRNLRVIKLPCYRVNWNKYSFTMRLHLILIRISEAVSWRISNLVFLSVGLLLPLSSDFLLVPRLRMREVIPLLNLYVSMGWRESLTLITTVQAFSVFSVYWTSVEVLVIKILVKECNFLGSCLQTSSPI